MSSAALSLFVSLFFFFFSLLAVFKAPYYLLWLPALAATEAGTYLALVCVAWAVAPSSTTGTGVTARVVAFLSAFIFLTPLARAVPVAQRLPSELANAFGAVAPRAGFNAPARTSPLSLGTLFRGVPTPKVDRQTVTYSAPAKRALQMDIYRAEHSTVQCPAVLIVHGGSWRSGDRQEFTEFDRYLAARGYLVAAMDYELAPQAIFPSQRSDVFQAIAYLRKHSAVLGWDEKNLVLLGRSAGGQIALAAAYAGKEPTVRGVVAFYTPNDLVFGYEHAGATRILDSKALIRNYLGNSLAEGRAAYEAASPLNAVGPATPPTLMIHGSRDELVWPVHEDRLSAKLEAFHRPHFYLKLPWATHGCDALLNGPSGQLSTYAVERFLAAVMPVKHGRAL